MAARAQQGGVNLGLQENIEIWWQGYSGLSLVDLQKKLVTLLTVSSAPDILIIHCGGNDLGKYPVQKLRCFLCSLVQFLNENFSKAHIIWSQILPRTNWRYSENNAAMHRVRQRLNNHAANLFIDRQGTYLKHPSLQVSGPICYKPDGVHLNQYGNELFLHHIAKAIQYVVNNGHTRIVE